MECIINEIFISMQVSRYLVKSFRQAKSKKNNLADSVQYLASSKLEKRQPIDLNSTQSIVDQFRQVAFGQVQEAVQSLDQWIATGGKKPEEDAWNNASVELASASLAHLRYFVINVNADNLTNGLITISKSLKNVLLDLFEMLAFTWIQQNFGDFLRHSGLQVRYFYELRNHYELAKKMYRISRKFQTLL